MFRKKEKTDWEETLDTIGLWENMPESMRKYDYLTKLYGYLSYVMAEIYKNRVNDGEELSEEIAYSFHEISAYYQEKSSFFNQKVFEF